MNKRRTPLLIVLAFILCLGIIPTRAALCDSVNLLTNGSFEEADEYGFPTGWRKDMYVYDDGVTLYDTIKEGAYDGSTCVRLRSFSENDARYIQTVACEPNSYYKLSGWARTEGVTAEQMGANLSIGNAFSYSNVVQGDTSDWTYMEIYGLTGPDQTEMTVMARLGFYGSTIAGTAYFDDISLEKVDSIPDGSMFGYFFQENASDNSSGTTVEDNGAKSYTGTFLIIAEAYAALGALLIYLRDRRKLPSLAAPAYENSVLYSMLTIAFVARIIVGALVSGYPNDIACWQGWGSRVISGGTWTFYTSGDWCDYPPGYMYVLGLISGLRSLLGAESSAAMSQVLVKLPAIFCDMLSASLLFKWAKREKIDGGMAMWLAAFYALNPATLFDSAAWGQIDSVFTLLIVLAVYYCVNGNWIVALPIYVVSALVKPQTLMLAPIALVVLIVEIVRAGNNRLNTLKNIGIGLGLSVAAAAVIVLPFWGGQKWDWLILKYTETLSSYNHATVNAMNLYALFNMNWADATTTTLLGVPVNILGYIFMGLAIAYSAFMYIRAKDRRVMPLCCALLIMLLFTFTTKMHERYAFPAIMLLILAYIMLKDKRLIITALGITVTQFMNMALVLQSQHMQSTEQVINGFMAGINMAICVYMVIYSWDICVKGNAGAFGDAAGGVTNPDGTFVGTAPHSTKFGVYTEPSQREDMNQRILGQSNYRIGMKVLDYIVLGIITVSYAAIAFTNLGTLSAPQTEWTSSQPGETVTIDLGEERTFDFTYYGGICTTTFNVEFSIDGVNWTAPEIAEYRQGKMFQWIWYRLCVKDNDDSFTALVSGYPKNTARYVRLTFESAGFRMRELGFLDENGACYPISSITNDNYDALTRDDPTKMIDEQSTVPATPSYYNSMYFDEIYHARTAYEHLNGLHTYEWTHPPLGKVLMMIGIWLFGMCPFGWRFMGTLVGVLMVPVMYLLVKQLFKRRDLAIFCTVLMTFDFMHFTQTRIATIDSYGVFFIMVMYLFMFRYMQMSFFRDGFKKTIVPLGLCGLFMGIGCASKWIDIYAAGGLAVLFFATMWMRYREYAYAKARLSGYDRSSDNYRRMKQVCDTYWKYTIYTLLLCCVFFVAIPLVIYFLSYYWQLKPDGNFNIKGVIDTQKSMFSYHSGLTNDDHPFRAAWYTWPFILKPMYYYSGREFIAPGVYSIIWAMGNPAVWWTSFVGMLFTMYQCAREKFKDKEKLIVIVSFLAQYLPWVLVPRSMYIYHYFASIPFLIISLCFAIKYFEKAYPRATKGVMYGLMAITVVLFAMFYPVISGAECSSGLLNILNALGPWNLY